MCSKVIVLVGLSGAGKSHLINYAVSKLDKKNVRRLVAVTTRQPRLNEIDGKDKYFRTVKQFYSENRAGLYVAENAVYQNYYAYLKSDLEVECTYLCELYYKDLFCFKKEVGMQCTSIYIKTMNESSHLIGLRKRENSKEDYDYRKLMIRNERQEIESMSLSGCFDYVFENDFTCESEVEFEKLVDVIRGG